MMIGFLLLAALQQPVPTDVALQVGLRLYQGERVTASATNGDGDTLSGSVWTDSTFCGVGSGTTSWSVSDRIRWQYTGRIVQRTSSSYSIEIEWQRDGGTYASLPRTTQQFVLQVGLPQVLDTLTPSSANACGVTSLRVEAAVVPLSALSSVAYGGFGVGGAGGRGRGVGAGAAAGGGGRGRGIAGISGSTTSGSGGARGTGGSGVNGAGANASGAGRSDWYLAAMPRGAATALELARMLDQAPAGRYFTRSTTGGGARGGGGSAGTNSVVVGPTRSIAIPSLTALPNANYDAELWLVHTPPGGTEETQHLAMHVSGDGAATSFPIVTVSTPNGPSSVDVAVVLRAMSDANGATVLRVIIARRVEGAGVGTALGSTIKEIPVPAPSDTVSFELPELNVAAQSALADHRFAVRLKMTPGKDDVR